MYIFINRLKFDFTTTMILTKHYQSVIISKKNLIEVLGNF